jgi:hypothetical protein
MNGPFAMAGHHRHKTAICIHSRVRLERTEIGLKSSSHSVLKKKKLSDMYEHSMMITCLDLLYTEGFKFINTLYCNVKFDMNIKHIKLVTECNTKFGIYKSCSHNVFRMIVTLHGYFP